MFEPSASTNALRPSLLTGDAPSMADSLPSINFGFDDLRDRMARFTERFDTFIAKGRKQVLEGRNRFRINLAELQEDQRLKSREIENLAHKSSSHAQTIDKEAAETAEMHAAIASITQQRDARAQHRDRIRSEIATIRKQIAQRISAQQHYAKAIDEQAQLNVPELDFWQTYLCMRIEGTGTVDRLRFVFTHVDEKDWEREVCFELDTEKKDYRVASVKPKVDAEQIERCVERLNNNRDLGPFLKRMRDLLSAPVK
ncbi:MAG: hypothetical protein L6R42_000630 [Xanthoria sp. 1 TBL-2021]|nr:MAG: hypothetical protein L6R42_000630 [Xanthoria sp. 1 TBL-2021]